MGGIQRMVALKANALAEIPGNELYIVVTDHKKGTDVFELSPNVKVVDLDINYYSDFGHSAISEILKYKKKKVKHRKAFSRFLNETQPDIVISTGGYDKRLIADNHRRSWKTIYECHYERYHGRAAGFHPLDALQWLYETKVREKRFDKIVVLTNADKENNWQDNHHVAVIPNPVSFECKFPSDLHQHCICSVGRLQPEKNFPGLIKAFKMVVAQYPDWILKIYGDGPEKEKIQAVINQEGLQDKVFLYGFTDDIETVMKQSSLFAFSSLSEGFGLVLLEAMECGVPVVSYDCPCGPREIITDGEDGFLVPVDDEHMMADRICALIADEPLRTRMGIAARKKAHQYQLASITEKWMGLFNDLLKSKAS